MRADTTSRRGGRKPATGTLFRLVALGALFTVLWMGATTDSGADTITSAGAPAQRSGTGLTILRAELADRALVSGTRTDPIELDARPETQFHLSVRNDGDEPVSMRFVRIELRTLGVNLTHYDLRTHLEIPPGVTRTIREPLDLFEVDRSTKGYTDSSLVVYDAERRRVAEQKFVMDVQGNTFSILGSFVFMILLLAAVSLFEILMRLTRRSLPPNRFARAVMVGFAGAAISIVIVLGSAVQRVVLMEASTYIPLVMGATAIGFVLGYLTPGPAYRSTDDTTEDRILDLTAAEAVARATGEHTVPVGAPVGHESGGHATAQQSGQHDAAHRSGEHAAPGHHDSGEFTPEA